MSDPRARTSSAGVSDRSATACHRRWYLPLAVAICAMLLASSSFLGPDTFAPPPANGWIGTEPVESDVLADVSFVRPGRESPGNQPTGENIQTLLRAGGRVIHRFHLPVVRARLPKASVPALSRDPRVALLYRVLDPARYDWRVAVGIRNGTPLEFAVQQFVTSGGRVISVFENVSSIYGLLPDRSIPTLMRMSNVEYVEMAGEWPVC